MPIQDRLAFSNQLHACRMALWSETGERNDRLEFSDWVARLRQDDYRVAWLKLAERHNSPQLFISNLSNVLAAACPELRQELSNARADIVSSQVAEAIIVLLNLMAVLEYELVIILQSYQAIHNNSIHAAVQLMLDHLPPRVHLLISSAGPLRLEIAHWRVRAEVIEIGPMRDG